MSEILERVNRGELTPADAARQLRSLRPVTPAAQHNGATPPSPAPTAAAGGATEDFLTALRRMAGAALKLAPEQINLDRPLSDYGLTSITVTALLQAINAEFGTNLAPTVIFEFATPRAFAEHVARLRRAPLCPPTETSPVTPPPAAIAPALAPAADIDTEMERLWAAAEQAVARQDGAGESVSPPPSNRVVSPTMRARHDATPATAAAANSERSREPQASPKTGKIAVIGMAGVLPQCDDLDEFWRALLAGRDLITETPAARWDWRKYSLAPEGGMADAARWGGFIRGVDCFDSLFFGISPHEAKLMDPQQRIFLQTVWHTIEDAGYRPADLAGSATGVFVGVSTSDYFELMREAGVAIDAHTSTGFAHSLLANRVSFLFDWRGPSQIVDTACSSSLIALHRAVQAIAAGDCQTAIVGGVNLLLTPTMFVSFAKAGMLSPDGRCQTFDRRANGYVRGEGAGAVLLKPLEQAEADGDHIHAVILSSAENHGGRATSLTAPNPAVQAELLVQAYTKAGVDPRTIGYIETHGTGTALGDPLEVTGLQRAFAQLTRTTPASGAAAPHRCVLGAVKTNIGHLESAAGIAGLLKVLLALRHAELPPNLHFEARNPHVDFAGTPFEVITRRERWAAVRDANGTTVPRRAGVSSFGFGGAYAHVVVEEYPGTANGGHDRSPDGVDFVLISAPSEAQLQIALARWSDRVRAWRVGAPPRLRDIAATSRAGRVAQRCRVAFHVRSLEELEALLELAHRGQEDERILRGSVAPAGASDGAASGFIAEHGAAPDAGPREALVRRWCRGESIAWRREDTRRVPLPLHPFEAKRCWFDAPVSVAPAATTGTIFFEPEWIERRVDAAGPSAPIAVFGSASIVHAFRAVGATTTSGSTAPRFVVCGETARSLAEGGEEIDATTIAGIEAALSGLIAGGCTRFVFLSESLLPSLTTGAPAGFIFQERVAWNVAVAIRLAQACLRRSSEVQPVTLACAIHGADGLSGARESAVAALLLSGYFEQGGFVGHTVRFEGTALEPAAMMRSITAELAVGANEPREVRYRDESRSVRVLRESAPAADAGLAWRRGATYLVAGGLGEVGARFAGWIAREQAATVVVIGRRPAGVDTEARLASIDAGAGKIVYRSADLLDAEALAVAVAEIASAHGALHGVFHLARAVERGTLVAKDEAAFARVTAAKVDGAINLDVATAAQPLDFFVLFSSIAADWGVAGAADYAYACRFQNEFAGVRQRWTDAGQRSGRTLAINWPQWRYDAHSHEARDRFLEERGFALLGEDAGFALLARGFAAGRTQVAFVCGDAEKLRPMLAPAARRAALSIMRTEPASAGTKEAGPPDGDEALRRLLAELSDGDVDELYAKYCAEETAAQATVDRAAPRTPPAGARLARSEDVRAAIRTVLAGVLQLEPSAIGGATPFERIGLDSILGVRVLQRLEKALALTIPPRWMIENPTIDGLAEKIRAASAQPQLR